MGWRAAIYEWGSTGAERARGYPCDEHLSDPDLVLFRAVDVEAPPALTFRWLCQLRAAPYSYDKLDNLGRRSPQRLTPGLELLEVGQRVQTIFQLVAFEPGRSLTMVHRGRLFGRVACTYDAAPAGVAGSRIVVKMLVAHPPSPLQRPLRPLLPPGDLLMMRRQLLNLKKLAERDVASPLDELNRP